MPLADLPQDVIERLNVLDLDPLREYHFAVQIDASQPEGHSLSAADYGRSLMLGCTGVDSLGDSVEIREVKEGGHRGIHRFPRRSRVNAIRLTKAISYSRDMVDWFDAVRHWTKGKPDYRRSMSVFLLDRVGLPCGSIEYEVWRWDLTGCWPSDWKGPGLNSMSDRLAFESITIQHNGLSVATGIFGGTTGRVLSTLAS